MLRSNTVCFKISVLVTLFCSTFFMLGSEIVQAQSLALTIPSGTPVIIKLDQEVNSKTVTPGSVIKASVANDVKVNGKVVIKAGAVCDVSVLNSRKAGIVGSPGSVTISVNSVKSVDGTNIPLMNASKSDEGKSEVATAVVITILCCILGLLMKGKEGVIPAGTQITGYTVAQVDINI
ncbi:MAG: hypothetical protein H8E46_10330 [FCB group bacterium]|nr:hypothetical protein [FCB group bacterium]